MSLWVKSKLLIAVCALFSLSVTSALAQLPGPPKKAREGSEERVFEIRIKGRKVVGGVKTVRVKRGEQVSLRWTTDETLAVHLHGYDIEKTVKPGETAVMSFKAHATGRFPVETHGFGDKKGKHIVLLYLEVLPR